MNYLKSLFVIVASACCLNAAGASYSVGGTEKVTLDASGEAVLTVKGLSKGSAYTFISAVDGDQSSVSMELTFTYHDSEWDEDSEDSLAMSESDERSDTTERMFITADDWIGACLVKGEDYDPEFDVIYTAKGYYLYLSGDAGSTVTITSQGGIVPEPIPQGCEDNPVNLGTLAEGKPVVKTGKFCDENDYWFYGTLEEGCRYTVSVDGVSGLIPYNVTIADWSGFDPVFEESVPSATATNFVFHVKPQSSGKHFFQLEGDEGALLTFTITRDPGRKIEDHPLADVLLDGKTIDAVSGARNDSNEKYFDEIIDTSLYGVELQAGRLALFETEFSGVEGVLEVYDSKGVRQARNFTKDLAASGQRIGFVPPAGGTYYVGICQPNLELADLPPEVDPLSVRVTGSLLYRDLGEFEPEPNDFPKTGEPLHFVLGDAETEGAVQEKEDGAPRSFDAANHVDWFVLGARQGITYNLMAATDVDHYVLTRPLNISVYTLDNRGNPVLVSDGDLGDPQEGVEFVAPKSTTYYVKVCIPDGAGCEVPYEMRAWVSGEEYGFLQVDIKGATTAQWYLKGETANKYDSGSEILLKADTIYTVQCTSVSGWTKPADFPVTVIAGNENRQVITLKYNDTSDPKDDTVAGAVQISPTQKKPVVVNRSLWSGFFSGTDDPADFFKLNVSAGTYYGFALDALEGVPVVTVYRDKNLTEIIAQGEDFGFMAMEKGTYYVAVTRADWFELIDAAYVLTATSCNVGSVKTDKTEYKVGEKSGYLKVKFSRTAKEGRVRVRYTTVAGTAEPNVHYVPQTGILEWADGDNKAKEVQIKLIPDLIDSWAEDREFTIRIDAVDAEDFDPSTEYRPLLAANELKVTVTDSSKTASGTVQFAYQGEGMDEFANPKKLAATVDAGENAVLWITRTEGADKAIGMTAVLTAKQTAGQEFVVAEPQEIWWEDGDAETKAIRIPTMRPTDGHFAPQTFTVKLTAIKTDGSAKIKNGSVNVTVTDGDCRQTAEEYAATFAKASGVTLKAAAKDTWYYDAAGTFRSVTPAAKGKAEVSFTVPAPGHLRFQPQTFGSGATFTCLLDKESIPLAGDDVCVDRYIGGTAKVTVKLTVQRDATETDEAYIALTPQADGTAFLWEPLSSPTMVSPRLGDKELVSPANVHMGWSASDNPKVVYLLTCDKDKKKVGTADAFISSLRIDSQNPAYPYIAGSEYCTSCDGLVFDCDAAYQWRVDAAMLDDENQIRLVNTNKTVWTFKTSAGEGAPMVEVAGKDAKGTDIGKIIESRGTLTLIQGVKFEAQVSSAEGAACSVVGKLPDGLKLEQDRVTKAYFVRGVPTKVGDYYAAISAKAGKIAGPAQGLSFAVEPINLASGTFTGLVEAEALSSDWVTANRSLGSMTVTATDAGKLTAKAVIGATSISFSGTGWDEATTNEDGFACVKAKLTCVTKIGKISYTNELGLTACRATTNDLTSLDVPMQLALTATMLADDKETLIEGEEYVGEARRDNTKFADLVAREAPFVGYYTATLPTSIAEAAAPQGNGYLTLTLDAKGKVKYSGVLADGVSFSGSSVAYWLSSGMDFESEMRVPVYSVKGSETFGGWVAIKLVDAGVACVDAADIRKGEPVPVIVSDGLLFWCNSSATAGYDGLSFAGFVAAVEPVGGYYSTIVNLQTYYRNYAFVLNDLEETDSLPATLIAQQGEGYECVAYAGKIFNASNSVLSGLRLDLSVNAFTVDKTALAYRLDAKGKKTNLIDWGNSVNPCKFSMTFKQATGIFNGAMDIYAGVYDEAGVDTVQKKLGSFKHQGLLVMTRDPFASLSAQEAALSGFYLAPTKIKNEATGKDVNWGASYKLIFGLDLVAEGLEGWE